MFDGLNTIAKRYIYIYQLMSNVQLPGSKKFDSLILIHSFIQKNDVSLAKQFEKLLSKEHCKHGVINKGKYRKIDNKRKWTEIEWIIIYESSFFSGSWTLEINLYI